VFNYLATRPFWVHLLIVLLLIVGLIYGSLSALKYFTKHGEHITVPQVVGTKTNDAIRLLESKGFSVEIYDSVYVDSMPLGVVLKQIPDANSNVKTNRRILLTVNRVVLPLVDVPNVQGKTLEFAMQILKRSHLNIGDTTFRPDFMKGSVLEQTYNGMPIAPGTKLPWGTPIDLLVGKGLDSIPFPVPDMRGLTFGVVDTLLKNRGLLLGAVIADPDVLDSANAFIWKQTPPPYNALNQKVYIQAGQIMDLWISVVMKEDTTVQVIQGIAPKKPPTRNLGDSGSNTPKKPRRTGVAPPAINPR